MMRYEDLTTTQIGFRWSPNALRGFLAAVGVLVSSIVISMCVRPPDVDKFELPDSGVTLVTLSFGEGDGTGGNKGNLKEEGAAQRGPATQNPLEDAASVRTSSSGTTNPSDPANHSRLRPNENIGERGRDNDAADERRIGDANGTDDGTGLGQAGRGSGKGLGYGNIDWGGGGNRVALNKPLPKKPPGTKDTQVKLRFRVAADGRVTRVWPIQRAGEPSVDEAAVQAMYQWKFNPLTTDIEMEGTITFTFKTS